MATTTSCTCSAWKDKNGEHRRSCPLYMMPPPPRQIIKRAGQSPDAIDEAHLERQRRFSEATFGPGRRTKGIIDHIQKELVEIEQDPSDLGEWVDVIILGLDGAWRCGAEPAEIIAAIKAKQERNEARDWPDWRMADQDHAIEHDRTGDEPSHGYWEAGDYP